MPITRYPLSSGGGAEVDITKCVPFSSVLNDFKVTGANAYQDLLSISGHGYLEEFIFAPMSALVMNAKVIADGVLMWAAKATSNFSGFGSILHGIGNPQTIFL